MVTKPTERKPGCTHRRLDGSPALGSTGAGLVCMICKRPLATWDFVLRALLAVPHMKRLCRWETLDEAAVLLADYHAKVSNRLIDLAMAARLTQYLLNPSSVETQTAKPKRR